ncbi:hypothetical protein PITCH_A810002 [uncultured Desulfobacterium sp.]|uniref:Uncharacterized protein n=1 Tax=uncultured Desulfobacterium sp. TaxID=201089 RepID=A0A445N2Z6_9BACT|nr:hypothetical protein PITCH_A810002 [uncultured Desulfobacterium sp.]
MRENVQYNVFKLVKIAGGAFVYKTDLLCETGYGYSLKRRNNL